jgi:hypothetical protein
MACFAVGVPRVLRCLGGAGAHAESVAALALSSCGGLLLAVVTDSTVQIWGGGQARGRDARACARRRAEALRARAPASLCAVLRSRSTA